MSEPTGNSDRQFSGKKKKYSFVVASFVTYIKKVQNIGIVYPDLLD